ncbi:MAG: glycerophosphodiester phosphodiesterase [Kiritimatiellae bacterium]|nr:glycerophosphodiester phosphodiesterase [Kiritimatiellia bacterium]MCO5061242.1 glycerophosphodiester phosphodiesterase [Kiritimatiellia bacterium]MCO6400970.1 glycerophosphodiester phosphodiesterase [Verrucomicrobiota bacterium]
MKLIAHRGASHEAPENTIPAIHLAWQERADGVEIDVRMTADGRAVLLHDPDTLRTSGTKLAVATQPWDAVRLLDVGKWKNPRYRMTTIPLFRDVLKMLPSGRELWVEVKAGPEVIPALAKEIEVLRPSPNALRFLGFSVHTMERVKSAFPQFKVFLNVEPPNERGAPAQWDAESLAALTLNARLDGLSVGLSEVVNEEFIAHIHGYGLELTGWVADDERVAARLAKAGLRSVMTNRPAGLRAGLRALGAL